MIPVACDKFCGSVTPVFPPNFIVLSPIFWSNWFLFTASVPFTPGATLVIVLFPALIPSLVTEIGVAPGADGVIVNPSPFITVLFPAGVLNSADVKSFNSFASFIFIFPVPSTIVPILLLDNFVGSVVSAPPTISNLFPNSLDTTVLVSSNGS